MRLLTSCALLLSCVPFVRAEAQPVAVRVRVVDSLGTPIPYALVHPTSSVARVASDSGLAEFRLTVGDSLRLVVRRIGFAAFGGWVRPEEGSGEYVVRLAHAARSLRTVTIDERRSTALARTGFYDRMERVRRGATVGIFITPEELEFRSPSRITQMLGGLPSVKLHGFDGKVILSGRTGSCPVTVLLDGRKMLGMAEEMFTRDGQAEIERLGGGYPGTFRYLQTRNTVDELLNAGSVVAVEVYPTASSAPAELLQNAGHAACSLVAFWTGARR